jgi:hypothetical protein
MEADRDEASALSAVAAERSGTAALSQHMVELQVW